MLKIWLPLNKDKRNIGLSEQCRDFKTTNFSIKSGSPIESKSCAFGYGLYHCDSDEFENDFTVATWVRKDTAWSVTNSIVSVKNVDASNKYQWYMSIFSSTTQTGIRFNINNGGEWASYNFLRGTWYHVAGTYNGTTKNYAIYVNGEQIKTGQSTAAKTTGCTNIGVCCRSTTPSGSAYTGDNLYISNFKIFSHALHDWEIKKIYNSMAFEIEGGLYLEGTENINAVADRTITETAYNGSINQYGYNDTSNLKKEVYYENGVPIAKVTIRSGSTKAYPYVFFSPIHPLSGQFKTLSFDYFPSIQPHIIPYTYRGSANVSWVSNYDTTGYTTSSVATLPVNVGKWNHIDMTLEGTSSSTDGWGYIRLGSGAHDANTSNYWLFKNVQVTNKDHPTKYSWSNREEWVTDSTAQATDIIPYNIVQSGSSLYFNGTDSAIKVPITKIITGGTWSINLWFYRPNGQFGSKAWETLIGGQSGFEFSSKRSTSSSPMLVAYSWGQSSSGGKDYEYDKWNMVTMVRTPSQFKAYLNGENFLTTTSTGAVPNGDYFIGAWQVYNKQNFKGYMRRFSIYAKAMSDDDVMNLYIHNE